MGLLGRGFAENLLKKGQSTRVWNRTASRTEPLVALGAVAGATPAETVKGAERVHMLLSGPVEDEAALRSALETMTGTMLYLSAEPDRAAKMKITGNGLLIMLTAAMGDLLRMGEASGVPANDILALFDVFSPMASASRDFEA